MPFQQVLLLLAELFFHNQEYQESLYYFYRVKLLGDFFQCDNSKVSAMIGVSRCLRVFSDYSLADIILQRALHYCWRVDCSLKESQVYQELALNCFYSQDLKLSCYYHHKAFSDLKTDPVFSHFYAQNTIDKFYADGRYKDNVFYSRLTAQVVERLKLVPQQICMQTGQEPRERLFLALRGVLCPPKRAGKERVLLDQSDFQIQKREIQEDRDFNQNFPLPPSSFISLIIPRGGREDREEYPPEPRHQDPLHQPRHGRLRTALRHPQVLGLARSEGETEHLWPGGSQSLAEEGQEYLCRIERDRVPEAAGDSGQTIPEPPEGVESERGETDLLEQQPAEVEPRARKCVPEYPGADKHCRVRDIIITYVNPTGESVPHP